MITANELRIGNWLEFDNHIQPSKFIQVGRRFFSSASIDGTEENFRVSEYYHPIPLTEELLLKCGFYHNEKIEYRLHCPEFQITIDIDDFGIQISESWEFGSIRYLHELQNLYYALTKTELIITP